MLIFYVYELLGPCINKRLEDYPLSIVRNYVH